MQLKLDTIKSLFRYRIMYHIIGIYSLLVVFIVIVAYISFILYNTWSSLRTLNTEVENYKTSVEFISSNKELLASGVDAYNKTLETLIPDEESYFSVVAALEKLAEKTGVVVTSYTIDLESTNVSKLSLRVEVSGTEEAMEQLLSLYKYSGNRLITIERVDLSSRGEAQNVFLFNFYHQQYTVASGSVPEKLTERDIELITQIAEQMELSP